MNRLLSVKEISELLQLHPVTITRYIREGQISAYKFGRVWRAKQEDVARFMEKKRKKQ